MDWNVELQKKNPTNMMGRNDAPISNPKNWVISSTYETLTGARSLHKSLSHI